MTTVADKTSTAAAPFRFFDLHVVRTERFGPTMLRVTFSGEQLSGFRSGGCDQGVKLFLPHPGQEAPVVPTEYGDGWFAVWREMDPAVRGVMRSYTIREQRRCPDELDIDFALHGDGGPAAHWAARAMPGDRVTMLGPVEMDNTGVRFRLPPEAEWVLLTADETALPAVTSILAELPEGTPTRVWIEVPHAQDRQHLHTEADADVTWLVRDSFAAHGAALLDALRGAELPGGRPYAWVAGEAGTIRELRRHLVGPRGFARKDVSFTGYWRMNTTEEQLVAEAASGAQADDS